MLRGNAARIRRRVGPLRRQASSTAANRLRRYPCPQAARATLESPTRPFRSAGEVRPVTATVIPCGPILLPPRCLEDQEGLTVLDDQASELDLLGSEGGI